MPIIGKDELQDLTQIGNEAVEGPKEFTIRELWEAIEKDEEIIIVIDGIEETRVRKGLSGAKAKQNAKLKESSLPTDDSTLEFVKIEEPDLGKGRVKLRIYLKRPDKIKIHSLIVADGEI